VLTIVPLTVTFALVRGEMWMRALAGISLPLIINLLILCNSRGATLGLLGSGASAFVLARRGVRKWVVVGALVGAVGVFSLADQQFIDRQQTTTNAQDNSAQSRFAIWSAALRVLSDYPLGAGGRGFHVLSPRYMPELRETNDGEGRSAHNTYIQVSVEWGIQGFVLFVSLIGYTFLLLHRVRRECAEANQVYFASLGLQLGLIGTLIAAFFSNRFFGESIYWLCGLSTALYAMTPVVSESKVPERTHQVAA
jgi:putative inorganic carbon (hco3(-)) transporter